MRTVQSAAASESLRPFVRAFAQRSAMGVREDQAMPAYLETVVQFDFGNLPIVRAHGGGWETGHARSVVGPHTFPGTEVRLVGTVDTFAIFLQPMALPLLFGVPIGAVMENHFDADSVLGRPVAAALGRPRRNCRFPGTDTYGGGLPPEIRHLAAKHDVGVRRRDTAFPSRWQDRHR